MDAVTSSRLRIFSSYECNDCIRRKKQAERGCEKDAPFAYWNDFDGNQRARCPRRPIFEDPRWYNELITAYNFYKEGFLPHEGGVNDQPALYPFIMGLIDKVINECDEANKRR